MADRLTGKVAIVTGASRGIDKAIAKLYAQEGARVLLTYVQDDSSAQETLAEIEAAKGEASLFQGDVSQKVDTVKMAVEAMRRYGSIDILCANAGIYSSSKIEEMSEEEWDRLSAVNLKGTFLSVQACLPQMKAQHYGKIVVISSTTGARAGLSNLTHYGATKAGQIGFILCACLELAPCNITANAIAPGWVLTEGVQKVLTTEEIEQMALSVPMKKFADPLDVAYGALFLSTDESRYITGHTLVIDGGLLVPEFPI